MLCFAPSCRHIICVRQAQSLSEFKNQTSYCNSVTLHQPLFLQLQNMLHKLQVNMDQLTLKNRFKWMCIKSLMLQTTQNATFCKIQNLQCTVLLFQSCLGLKPSINLTCNPLDVLNMLTKYIL